MDKHIDELTVVDGIKCYIDYLKISVRRAEIRDGKLYATWYGLCIIIIGILVFPVGLVMRGISSMKRVS